MTAKMACNYCGAEHEVRFIKGEVDALVDIILDCSECMVEGRPGQPPPMPFSEASDPLDDHHEGIA